jgi:hypothetical protein
MKTYSEYLNEERGSLNESKIDVNEIYRVLMGSQFEMWYKQDFADFIEGKNNKKATILKNIKEFFKDSKADLDNAFITLFSSDFKRWYEKDFTNFVEDGGDENKILKQINIFFSI